jgi:hypothetical protein
MITFSVVSILFIVIFFSRYVFWRRHAENAFAQLTKVIASKNNVDLELATNEQIIHELFNRPNNCLLLLIPQEKGHDLLVNMHSLNVSPDMALAILKKTYEGIGGNDDDESEEEEDKRDRGF